MASHMTALPRALALTATLACTGPVIAADTPMSADAFNAYTLGRTLTFFSGGQAYGVERYMGNRQVMWSFLDGKCKEGEWYQDGAFICFVYEDNPTPQCWMFFEEPDGLRAVYQGREAETELYEAGDSDADMLCLGPEVGV